MNHRRQNNSVQSSASSEFTMYPSTAYHSSYPTSLSSSTSPSAASSRSSLRMSRSSAVSTCPLLLSVLTWSLAFLLISSCVDLTDARSVENHFLNKRSFFEIQCKGVYDKSIFARLDRICEDCYNLFREPQLHMLCKKNCFTTDYFKGCLDVLLMSDEEEMRKIQRWIKQLHGADPGV